MDPHGFEAGDQVTLAGLAFTCLGSTGITTTIFPDPQQSYTVDSITGSVGTSKNIYHICWWFSWIRSHF